MQNSAVITKIEYSTDFSEITNQLEFIPYSATLNEKTIRNNAGIHHEAVLKFNSSKNQSSTDDLFRNLLKYKYHYRITDANGTVYLFGESRVVVERSVAGAPGSFNGREIVVTYKSVQGMVIT